MRNADAVTKKRPPEYLTPELVRFWNYLEPVNAPQTVGSYVLRCARPFELWIASHGVSLTTLPRMILQDFVGYLVNEKGLNPLSIRLTITGVTKYMEFRRNEGLQIPEVAEPQMPRSARVAEPPVLKNDRAIAAFLLGLTRADIGEPVLSLLRLLPFCGLRVEEAVNVRVTDVAYADRDDGKPQQVMIKVVGKGEKHRKTCLLPPGVVALNAYAPEILNPYSPTAGWRTARGGPWLFPSTRDDRYHVHKQTVQEAIKLVRPYVRGMNITPHALRRTFGTTLARHGVPIETVKLFMGHDSITTTSKFYTFLEPEAALVHLDKALDAGGDSR